MSEFEAEDLRSEVRPLYRDLPEGRKKAFQTAYQRRGEYDVLILDPDASWDEKDVALQDEFGEIPPYYSVFEVPSPNRDSSEEGCDFRAKLLVPHVTRLDEQLPV